MYFECVWVCSAEFVSGKLQAIQNAGVQGRLSAIHASLEAISGATTAGTSEMREAIIQSLRSLHQAEAEFVASHQEVSSS